MYQLLNFLYMSPIFLITRVFLIYFVTISFSIVINDNLDYKTWKKNLYFYCQIANNLCSLK